MYCQCSIRLSSPRLCPVHNRHVVVKTNLLRNSYNLKKHKKNFIFFCTTLLFLSPLYTTRRPIAFAIVAVMPRGRVMYSNTNKHFSYNLRYQKYQTDINTFIRTIIKYLTNAFRFLKSTSSLEPLSSFTAL